MKQQLWQTKGEKRKNSFSSFHCLHLPWHCPLRTQNNFPQMKIMLRNELRSEDAKHPVFKKHTRPSLKIWLQAYDGCWLLNHNQDPRTIESSLINVRDPKHNELIPPCSSRTTSVTIRWALITWASWLKMAALDPVPEVYKIYCILDQTCHH